MQRPSGPVKQIAYRNTVYTNLTNVLQFGNEDERTWWEETASIIGSMMERADYDIHLQYFYLLFYHEFILSAFGPRPRSDGIARWKSFMTDDFTPIEMSWNFSANQSLIRFSIEPISAFAGTPFDPFNSYRAIEVMERMGHVEAAADFDLQWSNHFANSFMVRNNKAQHTLEGLPKHEHMSQVFLAIDFNHSKVSTKSYFFPILKSIETGISPLDLVSQTLAELDTETISINTAWNVVEDYMRSIGPENQIKPEFVALDCVNPLQSRIKVYFRTPHMAFEKVRDVFTLGGRLDDERMQTAVGILKELWWLVLGLCDDVLDTDELEHRDESQTGHRTAGSIFNFEIKPGAKLPEPKVYIPVRHYARSDLDVAQGLTTFFARCGWSSLAQSYVTNLEEIFPNHPLAETTGTQTYIAFAFKKKTGVYLTTYFNPKVYERRAKGYADVDANYERG